MTKKQQAVALVIVLGVLFLVGLFITWSSPTAAPGGAEPTSSPAVTQTPTTTATPSDTAEDEEESFRRLVLSYYEITNTQDLSKQDASLPSVATESYIDSYRQDYLPAASEVITEVEASSSDVRWVERPDTEGLVRDVTARVWIVKTDPVSGEHVEYNFPDDDRWDSTTWILAADGWKVDSKTVTLSTPPN